MNIIKMKTTWLSQRLGSVQLVLLPIHTAPRGGRHCSDHGRHPPYLDLRHLIFQFQCTRYGRFEWLIAIFAGFRLSSSVSCQVSNTAAPSPCLNCDVRLEKGPPEWKSV